MQSKQSHSRHSSREKVSSNESTHRAGKSIGDASLCGIFVKTDTAPDTVTEFLENLPKTKIICPKVCDRVSKGRDVLGQNHYLIGKKSKKLSILFLNCNCFSLFSFCSVPCPRTGQDRTRQTVIIPSWPIPWQNVKILSRPVARF